VAIAVKVGASTAVVTKENVLMDTSSGSREAKGMRTTA
jgi:hypothetical protein